MKSVVKYFLGCCLRFGYIYFPLAGVFYFGYRPRLESSCVWVNMVHLIIVEVHRIRKNLIKILFNFRSGGF